MSKKYVCELVKVKDLSSGTIEAMQNILAENFENVTEVEFQSDLERKDLSFLLTDAVTGKVVGFSTQRILHLATGDAVVFSGDTIITPSAWGELDLPRAWGKWMLSLRKELVDSQLYWFLISKGHRTYRFLSAYFKDFAPSIHRSYSEREERIILQSSSILFQQTVAKNSLGYYVLPASDHSQRLSSKLVHNSNQRKNHPEVRFFEKANPDFLKGAELVCILNFTEENMLPFCKRMLGVQ